MTPSLAKALATAKASRAGFQRAVRQAQLRCKHTKLAGCDYMPFSHGGSLVPLRVCLSCGMTEEGWGCGYIVLKGDAKPIERQDLYERRQGLCIEDAHKGPLLRKETTVAQLVREHFKEAT